MILCLFQILATALHDIVVLLRTYIGAIQGAETGKEKMHKLDFSLYHVK